MGRALIQEMFQGREAMSVEDVGIQPKASPPFPINSLHARRCEPCCLGKCCSVSPFIFVDPGGPLVIILASGSEVRGFDPGRGRWIFSERKNTEYDFLLKGSKSVGPVS